jgi:anti-sigma B factor antagonist
VSDRLDPGKSLLIKVSESGGPCGVLVLVHGEVDLATAPVLERRLDALIADGVGEVLVDLSDVAFCDVAALNVLLRAQAELSSHGGRLRLLSPCPSLGIMLSTLGLGDRLRVQSSAGGDGAQRDGLCSGE